MKFTATLELGGKTATGIEVPPAVIESLGGGRKPAVTVTLNGYRYRTTVGVMGGRFLIPVSAEHRNAAGIAAGDVLKVEITLDTVPREVELPADLAAALDADPVLRGAFDTLSPSVRKEAARSVSEAKAEATREKRIAKVLDTARAKLG